MFPLDPDYYFKQVWDIFVMFFLLFTSFSVPFAIAFDQSPPALKDEVTGDDEPGRADLVEGRQRSFGDVGISHVYHTPLFTHFYALTHVQTHKRTRMYCSS